MRCKKHRNGFTLIEMLIAASLVALVMSAVYGAYAAASRSTIRGTKSADRYEQGRVFLDRIGRQIRCAAGNPSSRGEKKIEHGKEKKTARVCFRGIGGSAEDAMIHLMTTSSLCPEAGADSAVYEATYRFDRGEGIVWYAQRVSIGKESGEMEWQKVGENVASLHFLFFDGKEWQENWSGEESELPAAVKVTIAYTDGGGRVIPMEITVHPISYPKRETVRETHEPTNR